MNGWSRVRTILISAFGFGVAMGTVAGLYTDGRSTIDQVRGHIGNLSAPWVLLGFFAAVALAASGKKSLWTGALIGLAATLVGLAGFYLFATVTENLGHHGFFGDLRLELRGNRVYLEDGVISGPVFGAVGAWWQRARSLPSALVAGVLLLGEPIALAVIGALQPGGVLHGAQLPAVISVIPGFGINSDSDHVTLGVYAGEFAVGLGIVAAVLIEKSRRRI